LKAVFMLTRESSQYTKTATWPFPGRIWYYSLHKQSKLPKTTLIVLLWGNMEEMLERGDFQA